MLKKCLTLTSITAILFSLLIMIGCSMPGNEGKSGSANTAGSSLEAEVEASFAAVNVATPDGFAGMAGTTGGGNASPQVVTTAAQFKSAISGNSSKVIIVKGRLKVGGVSIGSNTTIIGEGDNAALYGGSIRLRGSNYILQNLEFGPAGGDVMEASGAKKLFVTKCSFHDSSDELFSIVRGSDNVTVSWCKFYFDNPTSHSFGHLIGHSDNVSGDNFHVTMHHNWYDKGLVERMPRVRNGQVHIYNNLYISDNDHYCVGVGKGAQIYLEECHFENQGQAFRKMGSNGKATYKNIKLVNSSLGYDAPESSFRPPYSYHADPVANVPEIVRKGAGSGASGSHSSSSTPPTSSSSSSTSSSSSSSGTTTEVFELENASIVSGKVEKKNSGYSGTGYANTDNKNGMYLEFPVDAASAGSYTFDFRYALSSGNRYASIQVNGTTVVSRIDFNQTGSWKQWGNSAVKVALKAGTNTVRITATQSGGLPNMDKVDITGE